MNPIILDDFNEFFRALISEMVLKMLFAAEIKRGRFNRRCDDIPARACWKDDQAMQIVSRYGTVRCMW